MHAAPLPPKWEPGGWAKGLFLPPSTVVTWQIDSNGDPTHDQGATLLNVDLVECLCSAGATIWMWWHLRRPLFNTTHDSGSATAENGVEHATRPAKPPLELAL